MQRGGLPVLGRRTFFCLLALLFAVDCGKHVLTFAAGPVPLHEDSLHYWALARQMSDGDLFLTRQAGTGRTPGYPGFLAGCMFLFGDRALLAVVVLQHLSGLAVSLIAAWTCGQISGTRVGMLLGYFVMILCISRPAFANMILSETLYTFALALSLAVVIAYNMKPTTGKAVAMGLTLGATLLVRPVSQALWVPVVGIMLLQPRWTMRGPTVRRAVVHGLLVVALMAAMIAPWYIRNYCLFGEPFLTKFLGRNMWISAFNPCGADLDLADGEASRRLKSMIAEVGLKADWESTWSVSDGLYNQAHLTEPEVDDLMLRVSLEAIRAEPRRFAWSYFERTAYYWAVQPSNIEWFPYEAHLQIPGATYRGQAIWHWQRWGGGYARQVNKLPRHSYLLLAISAWCFAGTMALSLRRKTRAAGMTLLLTLLYFCLLTCFVECVMYRYRLIIEPAMLIAAVSGTLLAFRMLRACLRTKHVRTTT